MRVAKFIYSIFRKFPSLLSANIALLILISFFGACSLFAISPIIDFLIHPDLKGVSPLTQKATGLME